MVIFEDFEDVKTNVQEYSFTAYQKRSFRGTLTNGKLTGISALHAKHFFRKINISFIVDFYLGKYSFKLYR